MIWQISLSLRVPDKYLTPKSHSSTSLLVRKCKEELNCLVHQYGITLMWNPAHRGYFGYEQADELSRMKSAQSIPNAEIVVFLFKLLRT